MKKQSGTMRTLRRLLQYLLQFKGLLILALALTLGSNLLSLIGPMLSGYAIDALEFGEGAVQFDKVFYYCGLMLVCYIVSSVLSYALSILMIYLSQKVVYQMREDIFSKLLNLPVRFFDGCQAGDVISRVNYDIDTINTSLSSDVVQVCTTVITVIGSFISMLYLSPALLAIFMLTIPITVLFTKKKATEIQPLFRKRSRALGELNGYVEEIVSGQKTIRAYGRENYMIDRFDVKNTEAVNAYYDADYYGAMIGPGVNFINNLSMSLISTGGAIMYLFGYITLGKVSSFILYSRKFSGPINEMANIMSELQSAVAAAERVLSLIDEEPEPPDIPEARELEHVRGQVDLEHVHFGYEPGRTVIHNLNLHVQPGQLVAIVGPTGAGKTTIINLLMRFYDPQGGQIFIDGQDIAGLTRSSLRRCYTMVLQDTWLFGGTIRENIAYGRQDVTQEEIEQAARLAHMHEYICSLPEGYDTVLSDDGVNLSKGQKQLLTIARAMLSRAGILILDEATSNVDTRTEQQIQDAMYALMENRTCFVIAHRLSTIRNADTILVLQEGDVVEQGTHRELMDRGGIYAGLYYAQFE